MDWIFGILILLAVLANLFFTLRMYLQAFRHAEEDAADEAVDKAKKEAYDPIGEGLDNIMLFSVNGKTGFEPENWRQED